MFFYSSPVKHRRAYCIFLLSKQPAETLSNMHLWETNGEALEMCV